VIKQTDIKIVVVDTHLEAQMLAQKAIAQCCPKAIVQIYSSAIELVKHVHSSGSTIKNFKPALLIIDLDQSEMKGFELLKYFNDNSDIYCMPIVAFTTGYSEPGKVEAEMIGRKMCVRKPNTLQKYIDTISNIVEVFNLEK
jgi:CheY-like chemotaxis protein